ncbi:hypothetical protein BWI17_21215 [Betaproteobacteria bacterium GR16-43]|nr:hypothetical protein BWI17_21215 [Betaproteobacteria bacterium GR16-43]
MKKSLYEVAGVPPAAPSAVIGMAIKRRLQKLQESGAPDAEAQAYALREAWSVLGDEKRRAAYDAKLAAVAPKPVPAAPVAAPGGAPVASPAAVPAAAPVAKPAVAPSTAKVALPDEMDLVFVVEEAHAPSRIKTYAAVAAGLLVFALAGLWMMTSGSRSATKAPAKDGVVDNRSSFAKARGAQTPKPPPPETAPSK